MKITILASLLFACCSAAAKPVLIGDTEYAISVPIDWTHEVIHRRHVFRPAGDTEHLMSISMIPKGKYGSEESALICQTLAAKKISDDLAELKSTKVVNTKSQIVGLRGDYGPAGGHAATIYMFPLALGGYMMISVYHGGDLDFLLQSESIILSNLTIPLSSATAEQGAAANP